MPRKKAIAKAPNNILSLADNPRFKARVPSKWVVLPLDTEPENVKSFKLNENVLGFLDGDSIYINTKFQPEEVKEMTLVVAEYPSGAKRLRAGESDQYKVIGIVTHFMREVKNG